MAKVCIVLLALLGMSLAQKTTPIPWAPNWVMNFTETAYYPLKGSHSGITGTFKYQFDGTNQRLRVYRADGFWDRYCGSVHEFSHTPCEHLVVNGGTRYLIFPQLKDCCLCCTAPNGCGASKPDWFMGGKLVSQTSTVVTFMVQGSQENWYAMTPKGVPVQINMPPESNMVFNTVTYTAGTMTDSDFALPTNSGNCNKLCPGTSVCGLVRGS